jgi:hypothetical protein
MDGTTRFDYLSMKGKPPPVAAWSDALFNEQCKELEKLEQEVSSLYPGFRPVNYVLKAQSFSPGPPTSGVPTFRTQSN